jgi:hypothetical protein
MGALRVAGAAASELTLAQDPRAGRSSAAPMARRASWVEVGAATRMNRALASALEPWDASLVLEITTIALVVAVSASATSEEPETVPAHPIVGPTARKASNVSNCEDRIRF